MKHLFLCAQPRSGSSWFLHLLTHETGNSPFANVGEQYGAPYLINKNPFFVNLMGDRLPRTYFFKDTSHAPNPDFDPACFREMVHAYYAQHTQNESVAVKWFPYTLKAFEQLYGGNRQTVRREMEDIFGEITWIRLIRRNVWRQAISWYLAEATKHWYQLKGEAAPVLPAVPFDLEKITLYKTRYEKNAFWCEHWFNETGFSPVATVYYEELMRNGGEAMGKLGEQLGVSLQLPPTESQQLVRLSNALNEEFYNQVLDTLSPKERARLESL